MNLYRVKFRRIYILDINCLDANGCCGNILCPLKDSVGTVSVGVEYKDVYQKRSKCYIFLYLVQRNYEINRKGIMHYYHSNIHKI